MAGALAPGAWLRGGVVAVAGLAVPVAGAVTMFFIGNKKSIPERWTNTFTQAMKRGLFRDGQVIDSDESPRQGHYPSGFDCGPGFASRRGEVVPVRIAGQ